MPAFLLPLLSGFLKCKTCLWVAAIGALALAGWLYLKHAEHAAAAAAVAEMQKATAAEHDRRMQVERWAQGWSAGAIAHVNDLDARIKALQSEVAKGSARHDKEPGLSLDAIERLRRIGQ